MVLGENKQELTSLQDLNQSSLILYKLLSGDMKDVMPGLSRPLWVSQDLFVCLTHLPQVG